GNAKFCKQGERIAQAVGNAFKYGTGEMRLTMGRGEADKCGANVWVEVRCALAEEIGSPEDAVAACRGFGGEGHQLFIGGGLTLCAGTDDITKPAQRQACRLGNSHNVPAAGHGVAEGVKSAERVTDGRIGGGKNDAGGADGGADGTGLENSHADCACALVAGTGDNGRASDEAGRGSGGFVDLGADLGGLKQLRKPLDGDAGGFGHWDGPAAVGDVE